MSAESAIQTATLLQQKVGNSLSGVTNLLAPPERSDSLLNAGAASLPVLVLDEVKELQRKTIESVDKVAQVLQSQLDLAEEAERRARDQAAELAKENRGGGNAINTLPSVTGDDAGMFGLTGDKLKNLLTLGLGSVFTVSALKTAFKTLGKRLLKGGAIASMVALIADPVIDYIDKEFELDLDDATKKDIKLSLVGAGLGFALAGIPGAIVGGTLPYISRVGEYIAGTLNANEVKDSDFAMTALGGGLAAYFTAGKVGALLKLSTLPKVATFGAALASVPVMIGIGAAVALGVGVTYIAKKVDEYQEKMLDTLADRMVDLDKEMGEFAAKQEEGLFERMGIQLGNLSALGQARVASEEAFEQIGQDKEKFMADTQSQTTLNNASAKQVVRTLSGIAKGKPVVTGDAPQVKKFDPVADQDNRLMQMLELSLAIKDKKSEYDDLRKSFTNDLKAALDDNEDNPKIRHSENERVHVYLSKRRVYKYSDKLTAKRLKLEAQMADLKDEEAKEVRHNKAELTKETFTVSFKG